MASVNRYTKIAPARYTPRTLQEMMITPGYKRQQHDTLDEQLSATETALAQVDPLDVHSERARAEQQKLYDQLSKQAEQLGSEGFTPTSKSDFTRLNKQYQQAISPTGDLGKIQAAKKAYAQNYKDYMTDALKKWDRNTAERNWAKFAQGYTGEDEEGNISNIGQLGAPERVELSEKLKDAKALLGDQVVKEIAAGNYSFERQEDGSLAVVNRSGRRIETSNAPNIQNAMNRLNLELSDPNSAWRKSIEFEGLNPELLAGQMTEGFKSMFSNKVTDTRKESLAIQGYKNRLDEEYANKNIDFEKYTGQTIDLFHKNDINKLKGVLSGDITVVGEDYMRRGEPSLLTAIFDTIAGNAPLTDETFDSFDDPLKRRVETVFEGLKRRGDIDNDAKIGDEDSLKKVVNYMETHPDETTQPKLITEKNISNAVEKAKKIVAQARSREFYDLSSNNTYTYDDMIKKGYYTGDTKKDEVLTSYRGQMTSDNRTSTIMPTDQAENYVMPHVVTIKGKEFLVPGSESERNSDWYKKESKFHNEYNQLLPGLPKGYSWNYQDEDGTDVTRDITITSQGDNTYIMEGRSLKNPSRPVRQLLTEAEMKEMFTDLTSK